MLFRSNRTEQNRTEQNRTEQNPKAPAVAGAFYFFIHFQPASNGFRYLAPSPASSGLFYCLLPQLPTVAMTDEATWRAMSEEQLKAFLEKVKADTSLQEKLKAASDADAVVAIAKAAGFTITTEDLNSHRQNLTEDELESVDGGITPGCIGRCTYVIGAAAFLVSVFY